MPEMQSVSSSSVAAVGYDAEFEELHVEFVSSGLYAYTGVPPHIFEELLASNSIGAFVNQTIKPNFPAQRI